MVRTIISLPESDKRWLDEEAARQHRSMTEIVREAVAAMRRAQEKPEEDFDALLAQTAGLWSAGDGLIWQQDLRKEWEASA